MMAIGIAEVLLSIFHLPSANISSKNKRGRLCPGGGRASGIGIGASMNFPNSTTIVAGRIQVVVINSGVTSAAGHGIPILVATSGIKMGRFIMVLESRKFRINRIDIEIVTSAAEGSLSIGKTGLWRQVSKICFCPQVTAISAAMSAGFMAVKTTDKVMGCGLVKGR